jgi:hypothetical protein
MGIFREKNFVFIFYQKGLFRPLCPRHSDACQETACVFVSSMSLSLSEILCSLGQFQTVCPVNDCFLKYGMSKTETNRTSNT